MAVGLGRAIRKLPTALLLTLRHPHVWGDRWCVEDLVRNLGPWVNGKSLAIVGNADSIFGQSLGAEIDACDTVIRMNRGVVRVAQDQGSRTDILCVNCPLDMGRMRAFSAKLIVWMGRTRTRMHLSLANLSEGVHYAPRSLWNDLRTKLSNRGPSTGLMALELFTHYFEPRKVNLYGFDWMETKTFYRSQYLAESHEWKRERELVMEWLRQDPRRHLRPLPQPVQQDRAPSRL